MSGPENQVWPPAPDIELDEAVALAMAEFYQHGCDEHIPTYAEEAAAYYEQKQRQEAENETG